MDNKMSAVIDRVRALFALSRDKGATENEAANAANQAQKLLKKYSLTITDLKENDPENLIEKDVVGARFKPWERLLAQCLQNLYPVRVLQKHHADGVSRHLMYIGEEVDVLVACETFVYLKEAVRRILKNRFAPQDPKDFPKQAAAYCMGAVMRIREKIEEAKKQEIINAAEKQENEQYALIVVDKQKKVDEKIAKFPESQPKRIKYDRAVMGLGYKDAAEISLHKQIA